MTPQQTDSVNSNNDTAIYEPAVIAIPIPATSDRPRRCSLSTLPWRQIQLEVYELFHLMVPTVIIHLGFTVCPFLTASHIGRTFGSEYLDGFTLAYMTGNLTTVSLLLGLLSASDTLSPQAFGAGNHIEVGLLAIRGFVGSLGLAIPINVGLAVFLKDILVWVGVDQEASQHAMDWYRIYLLSLPFYALYVVTWKFLSAQSIMKPLLVVCFVSATVVLPISLVFLTRSFGFLGSAMAAVTFQVGQALFLLAYLWLLRPHAPTTWPPGLLRQHWKRAFAWQPAKRYMILGFGGILMSSEFIYWESLNLMIGTLGRVPLSVQTIPTQVMAIYFMIPLGMGIALSIRLGHILPSTQGVRRAKILTLSVLGGSVVFFGLASLAIYYLRYSIYAIFLNQESDPDVWAGCDKIWHQVSWFYFNLSIFGINLGIATGLGMQWTLGAVCFICMWIFGFPAALYAAVKTAAHMDMIDPENNGTDALAAAWWCIPPAYIVMNVILFACFLRADWYDIRDEIRRREGMIDEEEPKPSETYADVSGSTV